MRRAPIVQRTTFLIRSVGVILYLVIGGAIGALGRALLPRAVPSRADVAIMLAVVGSVLGGVAGSVAGIAKIVTASPGAAARGVVGAILILAAFAALPRIAPAVLPVRRSAPRD